MKRKIITYIAIMVITLGLMPVTVSKADPTQAESLSEKWFTGNPGTSDSRTICLGTDGIAGPTTTGDGGEWSKVYYGQYQKYGATAATPIAYRVLSPNTTRYNNSGDTTSHTMFLDCDSILDYKEFNPIEAGNVWHSGDGSALYKFLNTDTDGFYANTNVFTTQEKAAIAGSYKTATDEDDVLFFSRDDINSL